MATALQIVKHFHPEVTTVKDAKRTFDRKAGFAAGQYQLNAPTSSQKIDQDRGKASLGKSNHTNTHKRFSHYTTDIRTSLKKMED